MPREKYEKCKQDGVAEFAAFCQILIFVNSNFIYENDENTENVSERLSGELIVFTVFFEFPVEGRPGDA
jgi:hypothetical protein